MAHSLDLRAISSRPTLAQTLSSFLRPLITTPIDNTARAALCAFYGILLGMVAKQGWSSWQGQKTASKSTPSAIKYAKTSHLKTLDQVVPLLRILRFAVKFPGCLEPHLSPSTHKLAMTLSNALLVSLNTYRSVNSLMSKGLASISHEGELQVPVLMSFFTLFSGLSAEKAGAFYKIPLLFGDAMERLEAAFEVGLKPENPETVRTLVKYTLLFCFANLILHEFLKNPKQILYMMPFVSGFLFRDQLLPYLTTTAGQTPSKTQKAFQMCTLCLTLLQHGNPAVKAIANFSTSSPAQ